MRACPYNKDMEKETFARPWDWNAPHDEGIWLTPSEDAYYLAYRWQNKKRFLDFGCGLGRHSLFFAEQGHEVLGFDLSLEAVERTESLLSRHGHKGAFVQSDMHHVGLPDGCCDCLLAYHVASHTTKEGLPKAIREMRRLLSDGGELYCDFCAEDSWTALDSGYPRIDEFTVVPDKGEEIGIPHCCPTLDFLLEQFASFKEVNVRKIDSCVEKGVRKKTRHYFVLAVK